MVKVELLYNHFTKKSYLYINSEPAPVHGSVTKFLTMPFHEWYRDILREIYQEVNDEFELSLVARDFECELLRKASTGFRKCVRLTCSNPYYASTSIDRLVKLETLVSRLPVRPLRIRIYSDTGRRELHPDNVRRIFNNISSLEVNCTVESLDALEDYIAEEDDGAMEDDVRVVFLYRTSPRNVSVRGLDRMPGNTYILGVAEEYREGWIRDSVYYGTFQPGDAISELEKWLEYEALPSILEQTILNLHPDPADHDGIVLCMLDQIEPMTFVKSINRIKLGETLSVPKFCFPDEKIAPDIELSTSAPGVISIWNGMMRGVSTGTSVIKAYIPGNPAPVATFFVNCVKSNPIQRIEVEPADINMTVGDKVSFQYWYFPADADNVNEIRCYSRNPNVVRVEENAHKFAAVSEGIDSVQIEAGSVGAQINVTVYPQLKSISFTPKRLELYIGESASYSIDYEPQNVLDANFLISADGYGTVRIDQERNQITAVKPGNVIVTASNKDGTVTEGLSVKVKKPFDITKVLLPLVMIGGIAIIAFVFRALFG